ncbi:MAG: prepilin-type N-terminal cleavage/methylation domain-containing protein [Gemmatimonadaceae bacterium]
MLKLSFASRRAFSLIEMVMVIGIIAIITSIAIPRLDYTRYRMDAAARQVRSTLQKAQRLGVQRQFNIVVSFDVTNSSIRILEDLNNNGTEEANENRFWYPLPEGAVFIAPPANISLIGSAPVIGPDVSTNDGMPSVIFRRDGSASTDLEVYVGSPSADPKNFRGVQVTKATGRTDWFKYVSNTWKGAGL